MSETAGDATENVDVVSSARSKRNKLIGRVGCGIVIAILVIFVVAPVLFPAFITWDLGLLTPHPGDDELIALLNEHRPDFDRLLLMFEQDTPVQAVHPRYLRPGNAIGEERWNEYRALFKKLGIAAGMYRYSGKAVWFIMEAKGSVLGGSVKGLVYRPDKPELLYENLDEPPANLQENQDAFRKIDDDWFIIYSYNI